MIASYIQELLATNNRVIVPNYGAFLVRATSKSKDSNTLAEKLKDIYFSPFLKFNDELLEKHIIKKESITKEQAAQKITQFIEDVKKELDQEKPYIIKDFGQFVADKQGKVQFFPEVKEVDGNLAEKKEPKAEVKSTAAKKTSVKEKTSSAIKESKKDQKEKPKVTGTKEEPSVSDKDEDKKEIILEEKKEAIQPKVEETKTAPAAQSKPIYSYKKKPVNKGLVWSIAIGLPVAAIFIWALLNVNTVKKVFHKEKIKSEKVAQQKKAAPTKETTSKPETNEAIQKTAEKTETKQSEIKTPVVPQKKYYIIAGSFKNEKYATSYLNKLKSEGYNAEKLAERNGMHAVSFNSFTDKKKAIAEYKFLAQEKGLQAWILYY